MVEYRAANTGVSGHGPNWRELGTAVQEEAERMFEGVGGLELEAGVFGAGRKEELRTVLEMGSVSGAVRDAVLK